MDSVWNRWLLNNGNFNILNDPDSNINWGTRTVNFNRNLTDSNINWKIQTVDSDRNPFGRSLFNKSSFTIPQDQNTNVYQYGHGAISIDKPKDYGVYPQAFKNIAYGAAILSGLNQMHDRTYRNMAAVASRNAALARSQIGQTGIAGANEANAIRERGERAISNATAGYGAMGVTADSGSATDVQSGIAERTERNAQVMTQNAMLKQWALGNEANQYNAQAATYRKMDRQNRLNGLLNTALSVARIYFGLGG